MRHGTLLLLVAFVAMNVVSSTIESNLTLCNIRDFLRNAQLIV